MALEEMYFAMKAPLSLVGGYGKLSEEQRHLFDEALDALMRAKFAEGQPHQEKLVREADAAVTQFLGAMPPVPEEEEEAPISKFESILIRASDALDRAGQRELSDELDTIIGALGKERE